MAQVLSKHRKRQCCKEYIVQEINRTVRGKGVTWKQSGKSKHTPYQLEYCLLLIKEMSLSFFPVTEQGLRFWVTVYGKEIGRAVLQ